MLLRLNQVLKFLPYWNRKITDTIRYPDIAKKIVKYTAFLPMDEVKYRNIIKSQYGAEIFLGNNKSALYPEFPLYNWQSGSDIGR
jgi:hypothetical protein